MKPAVTALALGTMMTVGSVVFAQDAKPSCAEDLEVVKLVYATTRSNGDAYLETLARAEVRIKTLQAQLEEARKKIQSLEAPKSAGPEEAK